MALSERDPVTGHSTTGHEWNGIKELNSPVPKVVWLFLSATVLFSIVYWVLMPAWPVGLSTYTKGILGLNDRAIVTEKVREAASSRAPWTLRIEAESYAAIQADEELMKIVRITGRTLFGDNCAVCHGVNATGAHGYPSLAAKTWLWGGTPEQIEKTITVGINSNHPDTRVSQMLAFGRDGMIPPADISKIVSYVQTLAGKETDREQAETGRELFAAQCASCHGADGKGLAEMGAPDLTDGTWIYGGSREDIFTSIYAGRHGHMPHWDGRLSPAERKLLTLYVLDLKPEAK